MWPLQPLGYGIRRMETGAGEYIEIEMQYGKQPDFRPFLWLSITRNVH